MAVVQTAWRKSYDQVVDYVRTHPELAHQLGFTGGPFRKGQYWERRAALGALPFLFFFIGLVRQLTCPFGHPKRVRLGVITGKE